MAPSESHVGLTLRERVPLKLEQSFNQLDEFLTTNRLLYRRSHSKAPTLNTCEYKLPTQPDQHDKIKETYVSHHPFGIEVVVR